jgi:hypothetical protein
MFLIVAAILISFIGMSFVFSAAKRITLITSMKTYGKAPRDFAGFIAYKIEAAP